MRHKAYVYIYIDASKKSGPLNKANRKNQIPSPSYDAPAYGTPNWTDPRLSPLGKGLLMIIVHLPRGFSGWGIFHIWRCWAVIIDDIFMGVLHPVSLHPRIVHCFCSHQIRLTSRVVGLSCWCHCWSFLIDQSGSPAKQNADPGSNKDGKSNTFKTIRKHRPLVKPG